LEILGFNGLRKKKMRGSQILLRVIERKLGYSTKEEEKPRKMKKEKKISYLLGKEKLAWEKECTLRERDKEEIKSNNRKNNFGQCK